MKPLLIALSALLLLACAEKSDSFGSKPNEVHRVSEYTAEERARLAPNALMTAVLLDQPQQVRTLLRLQPELLHAENADGNTAYGLSLRLGLSSVAQEILPYLSAKDLSHVNHQGESYVFLAAASGLSPAIVAMAGKLYQSLGTLDNFEFADLDRPNHTGQTALFVAANPKVAEVLESQYYRGFMEWPFWSFALHLDQKSQTYLHQAAHDGRSEMALWTAEKICTDTTWETSDHWWARWPANFLVTALRGFQTYIGDPGSPADLLVNRQNDDYQTALHIALAQRHWDTVRALARCQWLDYDLANGQGDLPLHVFLKSLNPKLANTGPAARDTFEFLISQNTKLKRVLYALPDRVNLKNVEGDSALHLAARLADGYYYTALARVGDIHLPNAQHLTPEQLRQNKDQRILSHGQ